MPLYDRIKVLSTGRFVVVIVLNSKTFGKNSAKKYLIIRSASAARAIPFSFYFEIENGIFECSLSLLRQSVCILPHLYYPHVSNLTPPV